MSAPVSEFMKKHFRHFNAATLVDAAEAYQDVLKKDGKMIVTMAGAMSTAEIGISLSEMIRQDKVHAISCTGANLEEDLFNLVAHEHYVRVPNYRDLTAKDEEKLLSQHLNRVTDTCIPEEEAFRKLEGYLLEFWKKAEDENKSYFPYEFIYQAIRSGKLKEHYQIDPKNSWVLSACEKNIPIFTPGWEDSTTGNYFTARKIRGDLKSTKMVKLGIDAFESLTHWYVENSSKSPIGFFQIGGGIAGDFAICVVPHIIQDLRKEVPLWSYFCQISDSTTSYGSYSGAVPNEKITWCKLSRETPKFVVESDASIVAPLMFAQILGW